MSNLTKEFATLNLMPSVNSKKQTSNLWNFAIAISIAKNQNLKDALKLKSLVDSTLEHTLQGDTWIYQLEDSHLTKTKEERATLLTQGRPHNLHFQINLKVKEKKRAGAIAKLIRGIPEFKDLSIYVAPASNNGKAALRDYCMKSESQVAGPWADKTIYLGADLINPSDFTPGQKKLLKYLILCDPVTCSKREIIWIYDPVGGSGKSAFKKYCQFKKKWAGFTYGATRDILYLVSKFANKRVYFFNLSKTRSADVSENELYCALEAIKDGDFLSTKYEPKMVMMNPCHVVVFANHLPNISQMTRDRLRIIKWNPLPRDVSRDNFVFDWSAEGTETLTLEQVREIQADVNPAPPSKKRKTTTDSTPLYRWISSISTNYAVPMEQEK